MKTLVARGLAGMGLALLMVTGACAPLAPGQTVEATVPPTEVVAATGTMAPEATSTLEPTATVIAVVKNTPEPGELVQDWTSTSPDGQWTATSLVADLHQGERYQVRLRVEGSAGAQVWTPVDEWRPMGMGYTLPGPVQWSADGQRLYFTNVPHPDGCSTFVNGGDLQVLDLVTGQVTELMPEQALWLTLSPDEARVAYTGYGERGLIIRDLASGQEQPVDIPRPVPGAPLGAIVWAPDGSALALTAAHDPCDIGGLRSVLVVDLTTGEVRRLVDGDALGPTSIRWEETGELVVVNREGVETRLDPETGAVVEAGAPDG